MARAERAMRPMDDPAVSVQVELAFRNDGFPATQWNRSSGIGVYFDANAERTSAVQAHHEALVIAVKSGARPE